MSELFGARRKAEDRERAAVIKGRLSCEDVAGALALETDGVVSSPCCGALDALKYSATGETAHCEACATNFDAISLAQVARGTGFYAACDWLEREVIVKSRCSKTGDLFS